MRQAWSAFHLASKLAVRLLSGQMAFAFSAPAEAEETVVMGVNGGEEGIRTLDTGLPRITV